MARQNPRFTQPSREYSAYIFDCDGTLVDTMPLHFEAWTEALQAAGAPFEFHWDLFVSRAGMSLEQTARELGLQFDYELDALAVAAHQRELYARLAEGAQPVHEVVEFAKELMRRGKPLAVASGSDRETVCLVLSKIGIVDWFEAILTPEDVERGKPHPDMFLLAAARLTHPAEDCLVIEDGEMGFEAARRANMDYCIVRGPRG
jgi:HAD superfamily hydrolase (TIGR01509 family)